MNLLDKQKQVRDLIVKISAAVGIDPVWATSIAMTESTLGIHQKSPTSCVGVFNMSSIAMKDLLQEMANADEEVADVACGCAFLWLLLKRYKTIEEATSHFCDPHDKDFYVKRVLDYMKVFKEG
jgi:hypothetical protein